MDTRQNLWQDVFKQRRVVLENESRGKFLSIGDVSQFQSSLETICRSYSKKHVTKIINRIYPTLDHVRSFTQAITACTQSSGTASLIWGAGLVLIEVRTAFP